MLPARLNVSATRSSPELGAPIWVSEWDDVETAIMQPRLLDRAEIPLTITKLEAIDKVSRNHSGFLAEAARLKLPASA